jgi:hypothetical protein
MGRLARTPLAALVAGAALALAGGLAGDAGPGEPFLWVCDADAGAVVLLDADLRTLVELEVEGALRLEPAGEGNVWILCRAGPARSEILRASPAGACESRFGSAEVLDMDAGPDGRLYLLVRESTGPARLLELDGSGRAPRVLAALEGARALAAGVERLLLVTDEELVAIDPAAPPAVVARRGHGGAALAVAALGGGFALLERRGADSLVRELSRELATVALRPVGDARELATVALHPVGDAHASRLLAWREERAFEVQPARRDASRDVPLPPGVIDVALGARRSIAARFGSVVELGLEGELANVRGGFRGLSSVCLARGATSD